MPPAARMSSPLARAAVGSARTAPSFTCAPSASPAAVGPGPRLRTVISPGAGEAGRSRSPRSTRRKAGTPGCLSVVCCSRPQDPQEGQEGTEGISAASAPRRTSARATSPRAGPSATRSAISASEGRVRRGAAEADRVPGEGRARLERAGPGVRVRHARVLQGGEQRPQAAPDAAQGLLELLVRAAGVRSRPPRPRAAGAGAAVTAARARGPASASPGAPRPGRAPGPAGPGRRRYLVGAGADRLRWGHDRDGRGRGHDGQGPCGP